MTAVKLGKTIFVYEKGSGWTISPTGRISVPSGHFDNMKDCVNGLSHFGKFDKVWDSRKRVQLDNETKKAIKETKNKKIM